MALGRVLVDAPDRTKGNLCSQPWCNETQTWDCYFEPLSKCTKILPADWRSFAATYRHDSPFSSSNWVYPVGDIWHLFLIKDETRKQAPELLQPYISDDYYYFILTMYNYYALRPNIRTKTQILDKYLPVVFPDSKPPIGLNSIFVRQGDKHTEAPTHPLSDYITVLEAFHNSSHPYAKKLEHLWIGSDSSTVIEKAKSMNYSYKLYGIKPDQRYVSGITWMEMKQLIESGGINLNTFIEKLLVELYFSALGNIYVCMHTSNWCRMVLALRDMWGGAKYPFINIDNYRNNIMTFPKRSLYD